MRMLIAALALTGAACSTQTPPPATTPPPPEGGACDAAPAQGLIGRPASPELAREAQRLTGAGTWRWLRPGQIVTMEFRADRLNLHLDAQDRVERIACG
ncbi:MAG TPA: I78 family peptidase inhibitor [Allosphingosinicella sp.]|nr:I78 family peptidase inhibitor [Allosphingosinicella sp.]